MHGQNAVQATRYTGESPQPAGQIQSQVNAVRSTAHRVLALIDALKMRTELACTPNRPQECNKATVEAISLCPLAEDIRQIDLILVQHERSLEDIIQRIEL